MKKITQKVMQNDRLLDTRKYRYIIDEQPEALYCKRIPLDQLDTTAAVDGWETVDVIPREAAK